MKHSLPPDKSGPRYCSARQGPPPALLLSILFVSVISAVFLSFLTVASLSAQGGELQNQPRRGLIYNGLTRSERPGCRNGFEFRVPTSKRPFCTHGPDPSPVGKNVRESVAPVAQRENSSVAAACDADGQSGNRVEVVYARASDRPDRFAAYAASIQQWAVEVDWMVRTSALQTGGERRVRYVHDGACQILVSNAVLSPQGDDSIDNTIFALQNLGYNRNDRKYLIFMDAALYCGIATMALDDSPWATNLHNQGGFYARVDAGCWGSRAAAHELMHTLGGVQPSAPHSTPRWHCTDESDAMCYADGSGLAMQYICESANESSFDCNHDDYFNTSPPPGSYLATHWNAANNVFLVGAVPINGAMRVTSLVTGTLNKKGVFTLDDTFKRGKVVTVRGLIRDHTDAALDGVRVGLQVLGPNGIVVCDIGTSSVSDGSFEGACEIPRNAPLGQWAAKIGSLSKAAYIAADDSITGHPFTVSAK